MPSQCAYRCLKAPNCLSFNYDGSNRKCELNRKTHLDFPTDFVDVAQSEYHTRAAYSIDPEALGPCGGDPCNSKGTCLETRTEPGGLVALCICNQGWAGVHCDLVVDAPQWGVWEPWSVCSVSCGQGWHMRRRTCEDTVNNKTIDPLNCYGKDVEYEACTTSTCPK
ncbi:A disintegrin and metalloproteinase with thrombospondin motifs adt-2-like [Gigantopelta aegis]|uniref:A disintegrin and metalloproteinase with thrombospondin motifs adt-2-like n=1 Tax=Gigantopelta aegis TaxID=1735272 RepID=UPI001B88CEF8|nr:A disintegrin and metalloproteinase with thrombospondin motifs adt-2-like [Gigantopelta aegis]